MRPGLIFAVAAVVAVAGCSASPKPARLTAVTSPAVSVSVSPTPTPSPTVPADVPTTGPNTRPGEKPPVEPVAALAHTAAGAKAFAVFFVQTIDWGYATTSSAYIRHFAAPGCISCGGISAALDRTQKMHHSFVGDRLHGIHIGSASLRSSDAIITVAFDVDAAEVVDSREAYVSAEPAIIGMTQRVELGWRDGSWTVTEMVREK
jgi:hypothetical protein